MVPRLVAPDAFAADAEAFVSVAGAASELPLLHGALVARLATCPG
jgi:hypothetical protein